MKRTWLVGWILAAGIGARAQECRPGVQLLTVYIPGAKATVPNEVLGRAKYMATKVLAGAGVTVEWLEGEPPSDRQQTYCGERLIIAFDAKAPARFSTRAVAYSDLTAGSETAIHCFYDRVSHFRDHHRMPEYLGGLLAHEIAHVLQGVARHSIVGVMKAQWTDHDFDELVHGRLPFTAEDVRLIRSHFSTRAVPVAGAVASVAANDGRM